MRVVLAALLLCLVSSSADAGIFARQGFLAPVSRMTGSTARPGRWCGWYMRTQKGGGPELNLARNWARWGRNAGGPRVGAVVVWPHHVGMITGRSAQGWIVKSGNDGHAVRERPRSIAGAIAFRI